MSTVAFSIPFCLLEIGRTAKDAKDTETILFVFVLYVLCALCVLCVLCVSSPRLQGRPRGEGEGGGFVRSRGEGGEVAHFAARSCLALAVEMGSDTR